MARMIPDRRPLDVRSLAERRLFLALRDRLGADWTVLHSLCWLKDEPAGLREGECDFLLLHPERGLLAIEVKSGSPQLRQGQWCHQDGRPLKDPCAQARGAGHHFAGLLRAGLPEWGRLHPPHGHALAFPDADRVLGSLPNDLRAELLLLEPDLERLQPAVEAALGVWGAPVGPLSQEGLRRALDILAPAFRLVPSLRATLARQQETLVRLGRQQATAMQMVAQLPRLLVEGRAGSGKTLLALEKALALAADGRQVLLLCYNRPLADRLATEAAARTPALAVQTFHDLCRTIISEVDGPAAWSVPADPEAARRFWDREAAERALDAAARWPRRFDAVLVDEGQDFLEDWWLLVETLLKSERDSHLAIFLDPRQDIYERRPRLPFDGPRVELPYNCRNSRPIAAWVAARAGLQPDLSEQPDGAPVRLLTAADDHAEREAVRRLLHELVHEQHLPADSIVVLGSRKLGRSVFAHRRRLGALRLVDLDEKAEAGDVRYATVYRFKGLEAEAVILVGCRTRATAGDEAGRAEGSAETAPAGAHAAADRAAAARERRLQYVGGSRARSFLAVIARPDLASASPAGDESA